MLEATFCTLPPFVFPVVLLAGDCCALTQAFLEAIEALAGESGSIELRPTPGERSNWFANMLFLGSLKLSCFRCLVLTVSEGLAAVIAVFRLALFY